MNFVADTHALLWWFTESPKLSRTALKIFEQCEDGENVVFIPTIVIAEALSIFDRKRIDFDFKKLLHKIRASDNFRLIALDLPVLQIMISLRDLPELHDKIIAATAKHLNSPIITKDGVLQKTASVKTVW